MTKFTNHSSFSFSIQILMWSNIRILGLRRTVVISYTKLRIFYSTTMLGGSIESILCI